MYLASRSSNPVTARYKVRKTHYQRNLRHGTVTIQRRCKYRRIGDSSQDAQDTRADFPETLEASFSFLPKNLQNPRIAVKILQMNSYEGSFLKKPALSISALLPPDAEIFHLIEEGDLNGLIRSLSLREAFLTDRDLEGRSLLSVSIVRIVQGGPTKSCYYSMLSISNNQISVNFSLIKDQMWTFLSHASHLPVTSKPLVVKHAKSQGNTANYISVSSLIYFPVNDCEANPEELATINRCRLLLIEAGADPTLRERNNECGSCIEDMLDIGATVFLVALQQWSIMLKK